MPPPGKDKEISVLPRSRFRRILRVLFLGGGLLFVFGGLLAIGVYLLWSYPAAMEARAELEKIRREWGVGSLAEMNVLFDLGEGEKDLAPHWVKVAEDFEKLDAERLNGEDEDDDAVYDHLWNIGIVNPSNPPWGQVAASEVLLKEIEGVLSQLGRIAEMDGKVRLPDDWSRTRSPASPISDGMVLQKSSRYLLAKSRVMRCKGDAEGPISQVFTGLSLFHDFEGVPFGYEILMPWAVARFLDEVVFILPHMKEGELVKLQEILSEFDFRSALKRSVVEDTIQWGDALRRGDYRRLENRGLGNREKGFFWRFLFTLGRSHDLARLYGNANRVLETLDGSWADMVKLAESERFRSSRDLLRAGKIFEAVLYYYSDYAYWASPRMLSSMVFQIEVRVDVALAAAAVERFRRKHGKLPGSLAELSPGYLPRAAPLETMKYVVGDKEYVVYSFGLDGEDDGGINFDGEVESLDDVAIRIPVGGSSTSPGPREKITGSVLAIPGNNAPVLDVVFSPDGKHLLSGCYDGEIQVRDALNGKIIKSLAGHKSPAVCLAFSPDGRTLLSGGGGWNPKEGRFGEIIAWDTEGWKNTGDKITASPVTAIAYSPNGAYVLVGTSTGLRWSSDDKTGSARYLNARTLAWAEAPAVSDVNVNAVGYSPDGKSVVYLVLPKFSSAPLRIVNTENGKQSGLDSGFLLEQLEGRGLRWGKFERAGDFLSGEEARRGTAGFTELAFSPDGKLLAFGTYGSSIEIWDPWAHPGPVKKPEGPEGSSGGELLRTLVGHSKAVTSVAFSPNGKTLVSGSGDHTIRLWNVQDGRCLASFEGHSRGVNAVAFSPDGKRIASASTDGSVRVWEIPSTE